MQRASLTQKDTRLTRRQEGASANSMIDLDAYTDEELKQALLDLARAEGLNDAEVQKFWQLYEEILRRRASSGTAA